MSSYATPAIPPCLNGRSCLLPKRRLSKGLLLRSSSSFTEFTMFSKPSCTNSVGPNILLVSSGVSSTMASWNSLRDESSNDRFLRCILRLDRPARADECNKSIWLLVTSLFDAWLCELEEQELCNSIGVGMSLAKLLTDGSPFLKSLPSLPLRSSLGKGLPLFSSHRLRLRLGSEATVTCWTVFDLKSIQTYKKANVF